MESSILRKYQSDLVVAISDPYSIAIKLFSRGVITHSDKIRVTMGWRSVHEQATLLLNILEIEVKKNQHVFYEFLEALKEYEKVPSLIDKMEGDLKEPSRSGLTTSDLPILLNELYPLQLKWRILGIQLGLHPGTLQRIESQYSDSADCLSEQLLVWLKTSANPTWGELIIALRAPILRETRLAVQLEDKFGSTSSSSSKSHVRSVDTVSAPEPRLKDLIKLPFGPHWFELGLTLDLAPSELDAIEANFRGDPLRCAIEMFRSWLKNSPHPTYEQLSTALLDIGQDALAKKITQMYGTTPATESTEIPDPVK